MNTTYSFKEIFKHEAELINKWNNLNFPEAAEMPVWHYVRTADRFLGNLKSGKINMGSLASMDDRHEGDFPGVVRSSKFWDGYEGKDGVLMHINSASDILKKIYIICWTARPDEHEGFWKSFTNLEDGVAVKSRISRLNDAKELSRLNNAYRGLKLEYVKYVNFEKIESYRSWKELNFFDNHGPNHGNDNPETKLDGRIAFGNKYFPAQVKRHSFFHEREVRLVAVNETHNAARFELDFKWENVIEEIVLAPKMDTARAAALKAEITKIISCPVIPSKAYKYV